jgi:hypothetical protein
VFKVFLEIIVGENEVYFLEILVLDVFECYIYHFGHYHDLISRQHHEH